MLTPFRPNLASAFAILIGLMPVSGAFAQGYSNLKTLQGFEPSVIPSELDALNLYHGMSTEAFKAKSQCHQRAHLWAYQWFSQRRMNTMKVYLFFTDRYKREFDYDWGYHVAPLVPVKLEDGTIEERVFDPTFTSMPAWEDAQNAARYDDKPVPVSEWIKYFIFPQVTCPLIDNYDDYFKYQDRYYCYLMKAPMYQYIPDNFYEETEVRKQWREGDLKEMQNGLKNK